MSWNTLDPRIRQAITDALPPNQLQAVALWIDAKSMRPERGVRWIADQLDLDESSVTGRLRRAKRNLDRAGIGQDASGHWHHQPRETINQPLGGPQK